MKNITFIIPTKNRSPFLARLLNYYSELGFNGVLAIGDSSSGDHLKKNKLLVELLSLKLNIIYREFQELNQASTCIKLNKLVKTPYVALLNDDDILIPTSVQKCITFLDNNPDYSAAHGLGISIKTPNTVPHGEIIKCVKKEIPVAEENTATERFFMSMTNLADVHHSVHRSEIFSLHFSNSYPITENSYISDHAFILWFSQMHTVLCGKVKELDILYIVRHIQDENSLWHKGLNGVYTWISSPVWYINLETYKDSIVDGLIRYDKLSLEKAQKTFDQGFFSYLSLWFYQSVCRDNREVSKFIDLYHMSLVFPYVPNIIDDKIIKVFRYLYPRMRIYFQKFWCLLTRCEPLNDNILSKLTTIVLPSLLSERSKYHKDFMPVYNSITNSSKIE
jgi:glycosyltransferase domain-containing protein|tara:strand:- start:907 stop:2082 length:1176 start_codon:yes stop_codon:yes gene_type:complete